MVIYRGEELSYEEFGRKKEQERENYRRKVEKETPVWQDEGAKMHAQRANLKVSRTELCPLVGVCKSTISRLEKGLPVQRRKMLKAAYNTALNYIQLRRNCVLNDNHIEYRLSRLEKSIEQIIEINMAS